MREVAAKSKGIQDYYSAVTMKSSGDISADPVKRAENRGTCCDRPSCT